MTRQSGARAKSNGAALEKYLENIHFREAVNAGYFLHWAKQNPSYYGKQTRSGVVFMPHKASGADWIVLGSRKCQWKTGRSAALSTDEAQGIIAKYYELLLSKGITPPSWTRGTGK